jgi:hypothetical protein
VATWLEIGNGVIQTIAAIATAAAAVYARKSAEAGRRSAELSAKQLEISLAPDIDVAPDFDELTVEWNGGERTVHYPTLTVPGGQSLSLSAVNVGGGSASRSEINYQFEAQDLGEGMGGFGPGDIDHQYFFAYSRGSLQARWFHNANTFDLDLPVRDQFQARLPARFGRVRSEVQVGLPPEILNRIVVQALFQSGIIYFRTGAHLREIDLPELCILPTWVNAAGERCTGTEVRLRFERVSTEAWGLDGNLIDISWVDPLGERNGFSEEYNWAFKWVKARVRLHVHRA